MQTVHSYGLYANNKSQLLDTARAALGQPPVEPKVKLLAEDALKVFGQSEAERCPVCHQTLTVRTVIGSSRAPPNLAAA
tara:strand:- start:181 stop:417 length:237 start_codon:yes stop_codon:yes gene_type:complete